MNQWFTRDSRLWDVVIVLSLIVGALSALTVCDPHVSNCAFDPTKLAYYGIPDWMLPPIRLASLVAGIVSAYMKTSPRPHSEFARAKITPDDYAA
jgi:hypothetical protein